LLSLLFVIISQPLPFFIDCSGKTTAFLLPIIERLALEDSKTNSNNKFAAVVLSPTRELANQIASEFQKLATFHPKMKDMAVTFIGGTNIDKDRRRLQNDQNLKLLIATPGRLQDHLAKNTASIVDRLNEVDILCLDEVCGNTHHCGAHYCSVFRFVAVSFFKCIFLLDFRPIACWIWDLETNWKRLWSTCHENTQMVMLARLYYFLQRFQMS